MAEHIQISQQKCRYTLENEPSLLQKITGINVWDIRDNTYTYQHILYYDAIKYNDKLGNLHIQIILLTLCETLILNILIIIQTPVGIQIFV